MNIKQVFVGARNKVIALDDQNKAFVMLFNEEKSVYFWEKIWNSLEEYNATLEEQNQ